MDPLIFSVLAASSMIKKLDAAELLKNWLASRNAAGAGQALPEVQGDKLKTRRVETLKKLNALRNRATLCITDDDLQQNVWRILIEQALAIYDAKNDQALEETLELVDESLNQVTTIVDTYAARYERLRTIRLAAIVVSVIALALIVIYLFVANNLGITTSTEVVLLGLPVPVILWSAIGSYTAILYRFSLSSDDKMPNPLAWFFSRPLTGVVMGSITYLVIKVGMMSFAPGTSTASLGAVQLMWLVAFIAGFSDRFSDNLLRSLIGKLGGDNNEDIVSMEVTTQTQKASSFAAILNFLNKGRHEQPDVAVEEKNGKKSITAGTPGATLTQANKTSPALPTIDTQPPHKNGDEPAAPVNLAQEKMVENTVTNVKVETKKD